jgi:hypothetical protein
MRTPGHTAAAVTALALLAAGQLPAQENPAVRAAVTLAAEGRGDSARTLVERELRRARPGDGPWVEALYWRARLSGSGDSAERDLRRVALEYPGSPWADDALLELSQIALAAGNPSSAFELAERLRSDYPGSDLRPRAALWAARAAFQAGEPSTACLLLDSARAEAAADIEFGNQVAYYRGRCTALLATPTRQPGDSPSTTRPTPMPPSVSGPTPTPAPAETAGETSGWYVQVYAARQAEEADGVVRRLAGADLRARVFRSTDGYHRVRLGPFASESVARDTAARARRAVGGEPFVVRER